MASASGARRACALAKLLDRRLQDGGVDLCRGRRGDLLPLLGSEQRQLADPYLGGAGRCREQHAEVREQAPNGGGVEQIGRPFHGRFEPHRSWPPRTG